MDKRIVIAGGSGLIGKHLAKHFADKGYRIIILSQNTHRSPHPNIRFEQWDGQHTGAWTDALRDKDILINLAGKSVNCRYDYRNRWQILQSRLLSTRILGQAYQDQGIAPKLWINASSATIYRHNEGVPMDELDGELGQGFSVNVCRAWEECFWQALPYNTRPIIMRTAFVLAADEGVLQPYKHLAKMGLGGPNGNGNQGISWIHIEDVVGAVAHFIEKDRCQGIYNLSAPQVSTDAEFTNLIRETLGVRTGLPKPEILLALGAHFIQTETELILKSRKVVPRRLLEEGFRFKYPALKEALAHLLPKEKHSAEQMVLV